MTERTRYIGAVEDQSDYDDGERVEQLRAELSEARAVIARKDRFIELLQAQIAALKALEVFGRLFQIADELDAQDKDGKPC